MARVLSLLNPTTVFDAEYISYNCVLQLRRQNSLSSICRPTPPQIARCPGNKLQLHTLGQANQYHGLQ